MAAAALVAAARAAWAVSEPAATEPLRADDLLEPTRVLLQSRRDAILTPFLADWPTTNERRPVVPATITALGLLPEIQAAAPAFSRNLVKDIARAAPSMTWRQTYKEADVGAEFLRNYGYSEIIGTSGLVPSEHIACGFLILGPRTDYPLHQHEAEEVYIPLSGTAAWKKGNGGWHERTPGTVIHHASNEPHAMRTGASAFLGLYLWRSADLRQQAHFVR
jgi:Dimethlysulfonioproprionate lyase